MNLSYHPINTKKTKTENNLNFDNNKNDFFRPVLSNTSVPINYNHENYYCDNRFLSNIDLERNSINTRNQLIDKNPVQSNFQHNFTSNFETLNNIQEKNDFLIRNPVNTKRDNLEKIRNSDKQEFLNSQGGSLNNYTDFKCENTRNYKNNLNSSNYMPMPRTMAIPKENI